MLLCNCVHFAAVIETALWIYYLRGTKKIKFHSIIIAMPILGPITITSKFAHDLSVQDIEEQVIHGSREKDRRRCPC